MGLFSDVEQMGLGEVNVDKIFKEDGKNSHTHIQKAKTEKKEPEKREEDLLFDKSYQCPICDSQFKVKAVRSGNIKMIDQDEILRPIYENHIDPLKYDVVSCPHCGYTTLSRYHKPVTTGQLRTIRQEYCSNFKGIPQEEPCMSYEGSLLRHKLALICAMKRNAKNSEKAYIFLKMAWLLRGEQDELPKDNPKQMELKKEERECIEKAYEGFLSAFSKEPFPMCGMDEISLRYIMAVLAHKIGEREESVRMLAKVLTSKTAPQRLKDKAFDLKEEIKKEVVQEKNAQTS